VIGQHLEIEEKLYNPTKEGEEKCEKKIRRIFLFRKKHSGKK
jgi:hypothetical protein